MKPAEMTAQQLGTVFRQSTRLMGNRFQFSVVGRDPGRANACIAKGIEEVKRIERLLTTFDDNSQTSLINKNAGIRPVEVSDEVFSLIERSLKLSHLTQGAFDITYGSMDKRFWNFDRSMTALPEPAMARERVRLINYRNVILDRAGKMVYLKEKGMVIGFGGIGKGYAAERAKEVMQKEGASSGIVNAAGDMTVWGRQPNGQPWTIGIADPERTYLPFASLQLGDISVATSGNYEKYVVIDGVRYSHTINPRTGYPVRGIRSVTIICPNAEIADAMATPVMVMGIDAGLGLINQVKNIACIIVDDDDRLYTSRNINLC
ncbi:MAG TPA: FAD:protein FMN transferase [Cyclobacteriaceae bacterium]